MKILRFYLHLRENIGRFRKDWTFKDIALGVNEKIIFFLKYKRWREDIVK